jgi:hypothetical protein
MKCFGSRRSCSRPNWHVGISWFLADSSGEQIVMHSGGDDGFTTRLAFAPTLKAGVVMMANRDHMSSLKNIREAAIERPAPFARMIPAVLLRQAYGKAQGALILV